MRHKQSTFLSNQDERRVLVALINYLQLSPSRAERLLICEAIKGLVAPKGKHRQARSRNQIERGGKKRRRVPKQKKKRVSNAVLQFVKTVTFVLTRLVIEKMISKFF